MAVRWAREMEEKLIRLVKSGQYTNPEIARLMGLNKNQVATKINYLGLRNPVYQMRIRKHAHLREPVMRFYLTHSAEETQKEFGLTASEFKSCLTYGYKDPKLKHLRKETRRRDSWTTKETLFLLTHAGVQPRLWIAKKLKRGSEHAVKENLERLGVGARYINGMPWSWAQEIFDDVALEHVIHMKAGPRGKSGHHGQAISRYRLIPWPECEELLDAALTRPILGKGKATAARRARAPRLQVHPDIEACIRALANFQKWIHGARSPRRVRSNIETALRRR